MPPGGETLSDNNHDTNHEASAQNDDAGSDYPPFDPDNARRLQDEARGGHEGEAEDTAERLGHGPIGAITDEICTDDPLPVLPEYRRSPDNPYRPPEERFSREELLQNPALRYQVDPEEFPLLAMQQEYRTYNDSRKLPLDETLSRYVGYTAGAVSVLAGESEGIHGEEYLPADHVIYLDKSARPVSWLVDEFWDDFTDKKERPEKSYLAIDRSPWFRAVGIDADKDGRKPNGELATFEDFKQAADSIPKETLARIRALFIPGGIKSEDSDEIFATPTILDGKVITVVDEVERTGSTVQIAKWLIEHAIPEAKAVQKFGFWQSGFLSNSDLSDKRQASVPVWYDAVRKSGRGVGEVDTKQYEQKYKNDPSDINRARKFGAFVLGTPENMATEERMSGKFKSPSMELRKEIQAMHREFQRGHILQMPTMTCNYDRLESYAEKQGLVLENDRFAETVPANNVQAIIDVLKKRPPVSE